MSPQDAPKPDRTPTANTSTPHNHTRTEKARQRLKQVKAQLRLRHLNLRWPVFALSASVITLVAAAGILAPQRVATLFAAAVQWTGRYFGSAYILLATAVLVVVALLAVSRFGKVRLGPDGSRPQYSLLSWASMLFAAGISTDIMFFAIAEPVSQYLTPPDPTQVSPESITAARHAVIWTMFHYGLHGWGLYALLGMSLAYFAFRRGQDLSLRSTLRPVLGRRAEGWWGHLVDAAAIVGGMFGIATSLGVGVVQLSAGLHVVFGLPSGLPTQVALLLVGIGLACVSALTDISQGIKFLCSANVVLAGVLAAFAFVTGRTRFLVDAIIGNIGDLVAVFPSWTLETFAWNRPDSWLNAWTLFFWAWWITWAAFVGLFLAKISRGRTVRQFVVGSLFIPFSFVVIWVGVMGNSALDLVRGPDVRRGADFAQMVTDHPELGLFDMVLHRPFGIVAALLAVVVGVLFYVTSADSGALVMAELSSEPAPTPLWIDDEADPKLVELLRSLEEDAQDAVSVPVQDAVSVPAQDAAVAVGGEVAPTAVSGEVVQAHESPYRDSPHEIVDAPVAPALRIFWALATGVLTFAMLLAGGIPVLQSATVVMALPFAVVIILVAVGLVRAMYRWEDQDQLS